MKLERGSRGSGIDSPKNEILQYQMPLQIRNNYVTYPRRLLARHSMARRELNPPLTH